LSQRLFTVFLFVFGAAALASSACAQKQTTITLRMIDAKTGSLIKSASFTTQVDRLDTVHADWVTQHDDGIAEAKLPKNATEVLFHASYDASLHYYVNCDSAHSKKGDAEHWYKIADILSTGIVAPNLCLSPKAAAKIQTTAKPGEFVLYVREQTHMEVWRDN